MSLHFGLRVVPLHGIIEKNKAAVKTAFPLGNNNRVRASKGGIQNEDDETEEPWKKSGWKKWSSWR